MCFFRRLAEAIPFWFTSQWLCWWLRPSLSWAAFGDVHPKLGRWRGGWSGSLSPQLLPPHSLVGPCPNVILFLGPWLQHWSGTAGPELVFSL